MWVKRIWKRVEIQAAVDNLKYVCWKSGLSHCWDCCQSNFGKKFLSASESDLTMAGKVTSVKRVSVAEPCGSTLSQQSPAKLWQSPSLNCSNLNGTLLPTPKAKRWNCLGKCVPKTQVAIAENWTGHTTLFRNLLIDVFFWQLCWFCIIVCLSEYWLPCCSSMKETRKTPVACFTAVVHSISVNNNNTSRLTLSSLAFNLFPRTTYGSTQQSPLSNDWNRLS